MALRWRALESDTRTELLLVVGLTTGILFLGGLATVYQSVLRNELQNFFTLSSVEWVAFGAGAFLVEPVLLFGALYYVESHRAATVPLAALLPGLAVAVVVGTLLGQYAGIRTWASAIGSFNDVPLTQAWTGLFVPEPPVLGYWRVLAEPLVRDFLTALAALCFGRARSE